MVETSDFSLFVSHHPDGAASMILAVEGVHCAGCIQRIERDLARLPGLRHARLNFANHRLAVDWMEGALQPGDIIGKLGAMGYRAYPFQPRGADEAEDRQGAFLLKCIGVAGFAAMNVMLLSVSVWSGNVSDITPETRDLFHWLSALIAIPAAAYAGRPFFRSAARALKVRALNMDVPISLGVILALGLSLVETANHARHAYFDSAIMLLLFLLFGRYLEHQMRQRTRAIAGNLAAMKGETAHRLEPNGELVAIPAAAVRPGDRLLLRAGDRVPADVELLGGASEVDESIISGETRPRACRVGDQLYAGSVNLSGAVTVRVLKAGDGTLIDEVERLMNAAASRKSKYLRLADRAARLYAPVVHLTALATLIGWLIAGASLHDALVTAIAVLIITCPCALALAIPAVQVAAASRLFKGGVLLHHGDALERLAGVDTVVFDKTGTLTLPEPKLANADAIDPAMLEVAARLAMSSHHPLARAVARLARDRRPYEGAQEKAGQGVMAIVDGSEARLGSADFCQLGLCQRRLPGDATASRLVFSYGGRIARLEVRQALRPDAVAAVAALRAIGLKLAIFSGDRPEAVAPVARALGVAQWAGGMKPADKIAAIEALRGGGARVMMVGDGLNDAPALASADVSISPITAADLTQAQADLVFLGEKLGPVVLAHAAAVKANRLMRQNLWLAALYNLVAVPLAIAGLATPLVAALAMSGSSLLVTLNALRARQVSR